MSDPITTCPKCGNPVTPGVRFCPECGHRIETHDGQPPTSPEVASRFAASAPFMSDDNPVVRDDGQKGQAVADADRPADNSVTGVEEQMSAPAVSSSDAIGGQQMPITPSSTWPDLYSTVESDTSGQGIEFSPPPVPAQWQPGAYEPGIYDTGAAQSVEVPGPGQVPPAPPYGNAVGQTQSIFSPPTPPSAQGQYTQPISPTQGYTPPPAYNYNPTPGQQNVPPSPTQPLPPGPSYPGYQQYQPGSPYPQPMASPKDPTAALLLELLGYLGFLGIGHIYAGKTNRGIALLIGWVVYLAAAFVLTFCLVGCFMFLAWLIIPPLSGLWVKNELEKERRMGIRQ